MDPNRGNFKLFTKEDWVEVFRSASIQNELLLIVECKVILLSFLSLYEYLSLLSNAMTLIIMLCVLV